MMLPLSTLVFANSLISFTQVPLTRSLNCSYYFDSPDVTFSQHIL